MAHFVLAFTVVDACVPNLGRIEDQAPIGCKVDPIHRVPAQNVEVISIQPLNDRDGVACHLTSQQSMSPLNTKVM